MHQVVARNYSEASENRIHSDDIARRYGFRGALVPGVAVYGYLTYPLVERLGESWLAQSSSSVRLQKPAYEGDRLSIDLTEQDGRLSSRCTNQEGDLLAELISDTGPVADLQSQAVFDAAPKPAERIEMAWDTVVEGQPFSAWHWQITEDANRTFAERVDDELPVYRTAAHPHWLLGIANRALTREYVMPAWIHVSSEIRFHELLKVGDTVKVRAVPLEKWERKGHQFVKLYLVYQRDSEITTEIFHTAIFRVAE
jgi:acyl dehydratase